MPTLKIDSILKGLRSYLDEEPKAEEELADFLDRVDVAYGNADSSLSADEWQTGLASDEAYNLLNYGTGSEEYWQNIFSHISRRFAPSPSSSSSRSTLPDPILPDLSDAYLSTTETLLREINFDEKGVDRNALIGLGEEQAQYLLILGKQDEASDLLGNLSAVYQELGDQSGSDFALARAAFLRGNLKESDRLLGSISPSSPLYSVAQELKVQIQPLLQREAHLEKVLPHIAALEQMRMRALEQLAFDESQIHDSWLEPDSVTGYKRELNTKLISKVNRGMNEMIQALIDGKVSTAEEAFGRFHEYTTLRTALDGNPPFDGRGFKQILSGSGNVDVEGLISFSKIGGQKEREQWLLRYTEGLRKDYASLAGFPANTIERNLQALSQSKNPAIKTKALELYANVTGESAVTGLSDAAFAGLLREGGKETVPMVLAMMIAGPVGAYAEGATAVRLAAGGMRLGRAGWTARAAGFGVEATLFWGANDALHATLIGGGNYFTGHGLASSFLMLGGLRVLGGAWNVTGGAYLAKAAQTNKALAPILGGANTAGQLATEFSGFWGLGQFEELIGLVPPQETTLRQELTQTAMTLMQLKIAVAAGQMVTGHLAEIKTLEIKLESTETLLHEAAKRGSLTPAELARALTHIEGLQAGLDHLKSGGERLEPPKSRAPAKPKPDLAEKPIGQPFESKDADPYARSPIVEYIDQGKSGDAPSYKITQASLTKKGLEESLHELMGKGDAFYLQRLSDGSLKAETAGDGLPPTGFLAKIIKTPEGQIRMMIWDAKKGEWFSVLTSEMVSEDPAIQKKWREMEDQKWDKEGAGEDFIPTPEQKVLEAERDRRFSLITDSLLSLGNDIGPQLGLLAIRSKHAIESKRDEGKIEIVEERLSDLEMEIDFAMFSEPDEVHHGGGESTRQDFMSSVQSYVQKLFPDAYLSELVFGDDFPPNVQAHIRRAFFTYVNEKISVHLKGLDDKAPTRRGDDIWLARARLLDDATASPYAHPERIQELIVFAQEHKGQVELEGADRITLERFLFVPEEEAAKRVVIDAEIEEAPRGLLAKEAPTYEQLQPVWTEQDTALRALSPEERLARLEHFEPLSTLKRIEGTNNWESKPTEEQNNYWGGADNFVAIVQAEFAFKSWKRDLTSNEYVLIMKSKARIAQLRIEAEREIFLRDNNLGSHLDQPQFTDPRNRVMTWYSVGPEPGSVTALLPEAVEYGTRVTPSFGSNTDVWAIDVPEAMKREVIGGGEVRRKINDAEDFNPHAYGVRHIGVIRDGQLVFDEGADVLLYGDIQMGNVGHTDYDTVRDYVGKHGNLPPTARRELRIPGGTVWNLPTKGTADATRDPLYDSYARFCESYVVSPKED